TCGRGSTTGCIGTRTWETICASTPAFFRGNPGNPHETFQAHHSPGACSGVGLDLLRVPAGCHTINGPIRPRRQTGLGTAVDSAYAVLAAISCPFTDCPADGRVGKPAVGLAIFWRGSGRQHGLCTARGRGRAGRSSANGQITGAD